MDEMKKSGKRPKLVAIVHPGPNLGIRVHDWLLPSGLLAWRGSSRRVGSRSALQSFPEYPLSVSADDPLEEAQAERASGEMPARPFIPDTSEPDMRMIFNVWSHGEDALGELPASMRASRVDQEHGDIVRPTPRQSDGLHRISRVHHGVPLGLEMS